MDFDLKQLYENAGVKIENNLLAETTIANEDIHNKIMKLGAIHDSTMYDDYYTLKNGRRIRLSTHPAFHTRSSLNVEYGGSGDDYNWNISDEEIERIASLPEVEFKPNFAKLIPIGQYKGIDLSNLSDGQLKTWIYTAKEDYTDAWVETYKRGIIDKETYEKPFLKILKQNEDMLSNAKRMRTNPMKQELISMAESSIKRLKKLLNIKDAPIVKTFKLEETIQNLPNENSLGEKIIPDDDPVKLQNFWNWFSNSKCVDEQGRPLVVYHGTNNKFDTFDKSTIGSHTGYAGGGFYFSEIQESSLQYDEGTARAYGNNIIVAYLNVKNPLMFDKKTISKDTYLKILNKHRCYGGKWENIYSEAKSDGILFKSITSRDASYFRITPQEWVEIFEELGFDGLKDDENHWWQVFEPNQIKSVNNAGSFSSTSNNIYETVAYHGTPQKFDEFSLKYIGKGEGHHFYGWGLYFAEDMNSAYNFNKMKTDGNPDWVLPNGSPVSVLRFDDDKLIRQGVQFPNEAEAIGKYGEKAVDDLVEKYQDYIDRGSDRRSDIACLEFLKSIKGKLISGKGAVYQVEIPDDEYLMIWENRIFGETSRNSKYIQNCLKKMFEEVFPEYTNHLYDMTGVDVYQDIAGWIGDKRNMDIKKAAQTYNGWQEYTLKTYQLTSMLLLKYGVKGIKYEKDGTNYVIFNPKDVHIQGDARGLWG